MYEYQVEIIHEPSGKHMSFTVFTEDLKSVEELSNETISDLSVIVYEGEFAND